MTCHAYMLISYRSLTLWHQHYSSRSITLAPEQAPTKPALDQVSVRESIGKRCGLRGRLLKASQQGLNSHQHCPGISMVSLPTSACSCPEKQHHGIIMQARQCRSTSAQLSAYCHLKQYLTTNDGASQKITYPHTQKDAPCHSHCSPKLRQESRPSPFADGRHTCANSDSNVSRES